MYIVYRGYISIGADAEIDLVKQSLSKLDLPWNGDVIFDPDNGYLGFCAILENKELEVRDAIKTIATHCPNAHGDIYCYGDNYGDLRRFVLEKSFVFEQRANIEYDEPGRVIFP